MLKVLICFILILQICSCNNSKFYKYNNNVQQKYNIFYQAHSWNDLNEYDQMYRKGTQYSKVDIHYMSDLEFCKIQKSVNQSNIENGCFVLSHDTPISTVQYNSSDDLINYIVNNKDKWYSNNQIKKFISLCFKLDTTKPCDSVPESESFRNATNEFIQNQVFGLLNEYGDSLNLEFILDGSAAPIGCLANIWKPLVSTWIADPWGALDSNNSTLGYDQFQVVDMPVEFGISSYWIDRLCLQSPPFGKFLNSTYPVLVWEPSDQFLIQDISESYIKCMEMNNRLTFPELRFAENIDPVQFQIYSSLVSNQGWNLQLEAFGNSTIITSSKRKGFVEETTTNQFNPKVLVVNVENANLVFIFFRNTTLIDKAPIYYHLYISKEILGKIEYIGTWRLQLTSGFLDIANVKSFNTTTQNQLIFISDRINNYLIYNLTDQWYLNLISYGDISSPTNSLKSNTGVWSKLYILEQLLPSQNQENTNDENQSLNLLEYYYDNNNDQFGISIWEIQMNSNNSFQLVSNFYSDGLNYKIQDFDLVQVTNETSGQISVLLVFSTWVNDIYALWINISSEQGSYNQYGLSESPVYMGVGSSVSLSSIEFQNVTYILQVSGDGFCFNTEGNNKRPTPRVCEQTPFSFPKILNYNFGTLGDWYSRISTVSTDSSALTSCDSLILHGTYDQGDYPNIQLYHGIDGSGKDSIGVVAVHQGIPKDFIDLSICGTAQPWDGIILDSWTLPL
ncbi:hypothetical protein DLAC_02660 [Tieghemostelium lacteum]|uniref:Uncharacterized protein n=1 Tax=Tieghemostelium lacteum TaxID=361077 RepID=A0A152A2Z9_TIELA|nr:hypothetical protein DLAC_02660 [Tieghemostelium lacteum]|eukprot:KYR00633.1 hypothetical protein DLAC_02660 [Tieghemostelium lacteum]